eukprot:5018207-Amphidinium_carterae.1
MGPHRDLECRLLSFPRCGREVRWVKAHTDGRIAALHGVWLIELRSKCWVLSTADRPSGGATARPSLSERQEKLQVRPQLAQEEAPLEEMEWPFLLKGHTLERELEGLRCTECEKGASDIAGPLCSQLSVVVVGLDDSHCLPSPLLWMWLGRL